MSDSEDEYEALREVSLARKRALFAELGLENLTSEFRKTFTSTQKFQKIRTQEQRKAIEKAPPSRRSVRIQNKCSKIKYAQGFMGFESSSESQESSGDDDDIKVVDGTTSKFSKGVQKENVKDSDKIKVAFDCNSKLSTCSIINVAKEQKLLRHDRVNIDNKENVLRKFSVVCEKCDKSEDNIENYVQSKGVISELDINVTVAKNIKSTKKVDCVGVEGDELLRPSNAIVDLKFVDGGISRTKKIYSPKNNEELMETSKHSQFLDTPWYKRSENACLEILKNNFQESTKFNAFLQHENENLDSDDDWKKYEQVMFVISTSEDSEGSSDSEYLEKQISKTNDFHYSNGPRRQAVRHHNSRRVPSVPCEEITTKMITNIAKRSFGKVYDKVNGTTCHQCRQKTLDTKTFCRSGRCVGVRGMFCGTCLLKRYGETASEALKNPSWECPVCRGICNCSICRVREGKGATGIMYPIARQNGYNSVAEYLKDKENKWQKKRLNVV